jgi:hypothetical protein
LRWSCARACSVSQPPSLADHARSPRPRQRDLAKCSDVEWSCARACSVSQPPALAGRVARRRWVTVSPNPKRYSLSGQGSWPFANTQKYTLTLAYTHKHSHHATTSHATLPSHANATRHAKQISHPPPSSRPSHGCPHKPFSPHPLSSSTAPLVLSARPECQRKIPPRASSSPAGQFEPSYQVPSGTETQSYAPPIMS